MKSKLPILFLSALATFLPTIAAAGEFRGTLTKDRAPVSNATIEIKCGNNPSHTATTDSSGFYRVFVRETGSCTLTVSIGGKKLETTVISYDRFVQNDLIVETSGGQETLRKK
jgi:hypothetical protein